VASPRFTGLLAKGWTCDTTNVLLIWNWRTLLHMQRADAACALSRLQHFSAWNDVMAAILKVRRHIENPTLLVDAYLHEEISYIISSQFDMKRRSPYTFFYRAMHYSAKRGTAIACRRSVRSVCLSACPSVTLVDLDYIGWKSWKLIERIISPTPSLFVVQRSPSSTWSQGNMGKFLRN